MKLNEIIRFADEIAPFDSAAEWDNSGLLVGSPDAEISRALLALDITPAVIAEAREKGAELIISHHPVIFSPLRTLNPDHPAYRLAKYDLAALCLHTDLDRARQGVNTALGDALALENTALYPEHFLLVGDTPKPYTAAEFAAFLKERLHAPSVRFTDGAVTRVAVSSGGGGEGVELAEGFGADAFVTGEMKHHQYLYAAAHGIAAFDAGHFSTEDVVIAPLRALFAARFPDVTFIVSEASVCPYQAI
ncbi:Nif3-like dinuclear metal center hexameric protein [Ruminococcus sp.]|uniref:Nif3-like dinuclear metal center hexameric protein n=1 Tax=Ruminococcus sp. TaxID=41978 RepID=UPI00388D0F69